MSNDLRTDEHEPADACRDQHCHWHNVDEDGAGAYIACFECGHVYRTKRALRWAYRRQYASLLRHWLTWDLPWFRSCGFGSKFELIRGLLLIPRAKNIHFCQKCSHDF